jgi:hypothetical protein
MTMMKKLLISTVAFGSLMALSTPAYAAITAPITANATRFVSGTSAPTAGTAFAVPSLVVDATNAGYTSAFVAGNSIIITLQGGATFANLPTVTTPVGMTATLNGGGAGQNFVSFQLGGTVAGGSLTYSALNVNNVSSVTAGSDIRIVVTDSAATLAAGATAGVRTATMATFNDPYSVTFTAGTLSCIDLGATAPGSRYVAACNTTTQGAANLGTVNIVPATVGTLVNWAGGGMAAVGSTGSSISLTIPGTPFFGAVAASGGCLSTLASVTTQTANVVTIPVTNLAVNAPGGGACSIGLTLSQPTTGTALLAAGNSSVSITLGLGGVTASDVTGTTRNFTQALNTIGYSNGSVVNAAYSVGEDNNYNYFINVTNGGVPGPVIVTATVGGNTGTAVLTQSLAANTSSIFSIATIRAALIAGGMASAGTFDGASSRGNLQVVVPTGARVTPLLLNKVNGQVVEVSRQQ